MGTSGPPRPMPDLNQTKMARTAPPEASAPAAHRRPYRTGIYASAVKKERTASETGEKTPSRSAVEAAAT